MERKLASIQLVSEVYPIPEADAIEVAKVLGWHVVIKKDEFKPGDKVIYIEIDSVLPERPEFEFMRPRNFRVRTVKLRGQVSQGICFPLSLLPEGEYEVDQDVTALLGITKYEPPIPVHLAGYTKGNFPSFIPKTDETRVQVLQNILTKYKGESCYVTEKVDGTSVTFYIRDGEFGVCSRNLELKESADNAYWQAARKLDIENKLRSLGKNIALQGELVGNGIQGNKYKFPQNEQQVFFFNAFDIDSYSYYNFGKFTELLHNLSLQMVPIAYDEIFELTDDIDALVEMSKGMSKLNPQVRREGIVIRPLFEINDVKMGRVSFKVINPDFLLKYGQLPND